MALIFLTVANLVSKASRGLIGLFIMYRFGVSGKTDAFFVSFSVIMFLYSMLSLPFESTIVPYILEEHKKGPDNLSRFLSDLASSSSMLIIVLLPLMLGLIYLYMVFFISNNVDKGESIRIFLLFYPFLILSTFSAILRSLLNSLELYGPPTLSIAVSSLLLIAAASVLSGFFGIYGLVYGFIFGEFVSVLFLLTLKKWKFREISMRLSFEFLGRMHELRSLYANNSNILLGLGFLWIANLVNDSFASRIAGGGITVYEYSMRIFYLFSEIYGGFYLYKLVKYSRDPKQSQGINKAVLFVFVSGLLLILPIISYRVQLISLLKQISSSKIELFSGILPFFLIASVFYSAGLLITRWFLAFRNTRILRNVSFFKAGSIVIFSFILFPEFDVRGIAISVLIGEVISFLILKMKVTDTGGEVGELQKEDL